MATLPEAWDQTILEGLIYQDLILEKPDRFTYTLTANHLTFDNWYDAVIDNEIYSVTTAETAAAAIFSPYIISHRIYADEFGDGACMANSKDDLGGVCLIVSGPGEVTTFRPEQSEWDQILALDTSVSKQIAVYDTLLNNNYGRQVVGSLTGVDYMDAYHCERIDEDVDYEIVCSAY